MLLYTNSLFALFLTHKNEKDAWKRNIHLVFDKHKTKQNLPFSNNEIHDYVELQD